MIRAVFAVLLLSTLLTGTLSACSPSPEQSAVNLRVDSAKASTVNGDVIYVSDVELEATAQGIITPGEEFTAENPEFQKILDQLIDQKLMAQEARRLGLDEGEDARRRLLAAEERILGNILVESLVAREVNEPAIQRMYDEQVKLQQLDDEVRIRHILVADEATAKKVIADLDAGGDFGAIAFEYSTDKDTRLDGGELGFVSPNLLDEPFPSQIANTQVGSYSQPFETDRGWHILQVDERRRPPPKTLEQMRPEIVSFLTFTEISKILRSLRAEAQLGTSRGSQPLPRPKDVAPGEDAPDIPPSDKETSL